MPSVPVTIRSISRDPAVAALSTATLINRLQDEAPGDPQRRWPAMVIAFQPLDAPQRGEQNLPRDPRSPVMTELIRRGVDAVPLLLTHLSDARPTRLVDYHPPQMINDGGTWFADGFDPRKPGAVFSPPVNHEVDFKTTRTLKEGESYTVKIGDLCFFALGQIVDRRLLVFGIVVKDHIWEIRSRSINSPVEFPALAAAARQDWGGLTRDEHEHLLEADAWENDALGTQPGRCYDAVQRLLFYYPEEGRRVVAALLRRPLLMNYGDVADTGAELGRETSEQQIATVAAFRRSHDAGAFDALHHFVVRKLQTSPSDRGGKVTRRNLTNALNRCFPDHPIGPNDRILEAPAQDQIALLDTLEPFDWSELPDAVAEMCERASRASPNIFGERLGRDQLVLTCALRLKGSPHFDACAKFLTGEINDLSAKMHASEAPASSDQPGGAPNQYREFRVVLNTWLHDASTLIAGH